MNVEDLQTFCRSFAGASERLSNPPINVLWYALGDKSFAYFKTSEPERWRFSFRTSPERFLELTDMPGVKPARYMGRYHWVTIVDVSRFDEGYLRELVQWSYQKALWSLSKRKRSELVGTS